MSENAASPENQVLDLSWILREWGNSFVQTLESMGGPGTKISLSETGDVPVDESALWWNQELSLATGEGLMIGAAESAWKATGTRSLEALGIPEAGDPEIKDTWRELLTQSLSGLAARLSVVCSREVTLGPGAFTQAAAERGQRGFISLQDFDTSSVQLCMVAAPALMEALAAATAFRPGTETKPETKSGAYGTDGAAAQKLTAEERVKRFPSLLGLEMPISLSFGKVKITLEEAMKLEKGSLIPLRQMADAQGELKMNNRCIARGRIADVNGYYALNIEEVMRGRGRPAATLKASADAAPTNSPLV
jgi:flagellar motor switch/type III secretory pathway protein FliN